MPNRTSWPIVEEYTWQPSIHIKEGMCALYVQPGSPAASKELEQGWHSHWPLLSSVRCYNFEPHTYIFDLKHPNLGDEPIIVVTQDHHLFSCTGKIVLHLLKPVQYSELLCINSELLPHILRPAIRQTLRHLFAHTLSHKTLPSKHLHGPWLKLLQNSLTPYFIVIDSVSLASVHAYDYTDNRRP